MKDKKPEKIKNGKTELTKEEERELLKYRDLKVKRCAYCGELFRFTHANEKYCSDFCKREGIKESKRRYYIKNKTYDITPRLKRELESHYEEPPKTLEQELKESPLYEESIQESKEYRRRYERYAFRSDDFVFGDFSNIYGEPEDE